MRRVYLNQNQLEALIAEGVQRYLTENEIDEGKWWQAFKGAASKVGKDSANSAKGLRNSAGNFMQNAYQNVANGASNVYQGAKNYANNAYQGVKNYANNAYQGARDYANSVKLAGERAGTQYENQQIIDQLEKWWQQGKFKGRTTRSAVTQLINALNRNFAAQYGDGN